MIVGQPNGAGRWPGGRTAHGPPRRTLATGGAGAGLGASCLLIAEAPTANWAVLAAAYALFGAG